MLIDDREAFIVDRDDERVAELAERDHRLDLDDPLILRSSFDRLRTSGMGRGRRRTGNPTIGIRTAGEDPG